MTASARGNRLPMLIALMLFGCAVVVVVTNWFTSDRESLTMGDVPEAPTPDADSPATVIKTLSAQVETVREQNAQLTDNNSALQKTLGDLKTRFDQLLKQSLSTGERTPLLEQLNAHLKRLSNRVRELETAPKPAPVAVPLEETGDQTALVWIDPLDADAVSLKDPVQSKATPESPLTPWINEPKPSTQAESTATSTVNQPPDKPEPIPFYTVPANATLMNATAWTALLGRIPIGGRVQDPWRFKILTGADNLAANGVRIPNLVGMVWSGMAVGDLALRCVSGELYSVTYVFTDGAINTVRNQGNQPLGWISDDSGIPCVPGELKTNAPSFLATRTFMLALEAGAQAYADAQTTRTVGPLGDSRTTVTEDVGRYALGETLAGGADEARRWFDQRQRQSFDAIFVPPGARLTINVEQEIPIDYRPDGRRVSYARRRSDPFRTPTLD